MSSRRKVLISGVSVGSALLVAMTACSSSGTTTDATSSQSSATTAAQESSSLTTTSSEVSYSTVPPIAPDPNRTVGAATVLGERSTQCVLDATRAVLTAIEPTYAQGGPGNSEATYAARKDPAGDTIGQTVEIGPDDPNSATKYIVSFGSDTSDPSEMLEDSSGKKYMLNGSYNIQIRPGTFGVGGVTPDPASGSPFGMLRAAGVDNTLIPANLGNFRIKEFNDATHTEKIGDDLTPGSMCGPAEDLAHASGLH